MKLSVLAGSTSQSINVFVRDSSSATGAGLAGLVFTSAGLAAYYSFAGANAGSVAITLATLAAVNSAWSSGGFKEIDATNMKGWYRLDLPNAALAAAKGRSVSLHLFGATNMAPLPVEIELTGWDNQDGVRAGLTALPNVASGSAGAIPTTGTGANQISVAAGQVVASSVQGNVTGNVGGSVGSVTTAVTLPAIPANWITAAGVTAAALNGKGDWLLASGYTAPPTAATVATTIWQDLTAGSDFGTAGSVGALIKANLDTNVGSRSTYAGADTAGTTTLLTRVPGTVQPQTGDSYARLGAPTGATVSADIAAVSAKTTNLPASPAAIGSAMTLTTGERDAIANDLLDIANGVEAGKTVRQALRIIAAALAGKRSNAGTATEQYDALGSPGTARIVGNLDGSGNGTPTVTP
ncbi:MAG: hypothetical protein JWO38_6847 [Gemmataceae bacterium]|nr:hypothetical protein [Gemmataceae bacterium]